MDNMQIWNAKKRPPKTALKTIAGGRLKGMTDIKPAWRYQAMTELFGPCGSGWGFSIEKMWIEQGANSELMCFAHINLWYESKDNIIPGIGGSKFIAKEKDYLFNNDECFKMAVTDALSTAMQKLGIASDIYLGMYDGSKYIDSQSEKKPLTTQQIAIADQMSKLDSIDSLGALWLKLSAEDKLALTSAKDVAKKRIANGN